MQGAWAHCQQNHQYSQHYSELLTQYCCRIIQRESGMKHELCDVQIQRAQVCCQRSQQLTSVMARKPEILGATIF